jgi:hypothetical protein
MYFNSQNEKKGLNDKEVKSSHKCFDDLTDDSDLISISPLPSLFDDDEELVKEKLKVKVV